MQAKLIRTHVCLWNPPIWPTYTKHTCMIFCTNSLIIIQSKQIKSGVVRDRVGCNLAWMYMYTTFIMLCFCTKYFNKYHMVGAKITKSRQRSLIPIKWASWPSLGADRGQPGVTIGLPLIWHLLQTPECRSVEECNTPFTLFSGLFTRLVRLHLLYKS